MTFADALAKIEAAHGAATKHPLADIPPLYNVLPALLALAALAPECARGEGEDGLTCAEGFPDDDYFRCPPCEARRALVESVS